MSNRNRIDVADVGEVSVVQFKDRKILDESNIQEMGRELFELVEQKRAKILLNFMNVEFLSSAALGKLITLDKKLKAAKGQLKLSNGGSDVLHSLQATIELLNLSSWH